MSEAIARDRKAAKSSKSRNLKATLLSASALLSLGAVSNASAQGISGEEVVSGMASVSRPNPMLTIIEQATDRAVIDFDTFDVAAGEEVRFIQPDAMSAILNRIGDVDQSVIDGILSANGRVFFSNPNGILFGANARIDVGALVASTAGADPSRFMNGELAFDQAGSANGQIQNEGVLAARPGGAIALAAPSVVNRGVIAAEAGTIALAGGDAFTLDFMGDGLLSVGVTQGLDADLLGIDGAVANLGEIAADNGAVLLTAEARDAVKAHLIRVGGETRAAAGDVRIDAQGGGAQLSGAVDVSNDAGVGGTIDATGDVVEVTSTANIAADGAAGGGRIRIGGAFQGGLELHAADRTLVAAGADISADAGTAGDGGEVIVWADGWTDFRGTITARGGDTGGDGGFVEVSGKQNLGFTGFVDTSAPFGQSGELLLDPQDVTIVDSASPNQNAEIADGAILSSESPTQNWIIAADAIEAVAGDITIEATNDISIETPLNFANGVNASFFADANSDGAGAITVNAPITLFNNLTLAAGNGITVNAAITSTNAGLIQLSADGGTTGVAVSSPDGNGTLTINSGAEVTSLDGEIRLSGGDFEIDASVSTGDAGTVLFDYFDQNRVLSIGSATSVISASDLANINTNFLGIDTEGVRAIFGVNGQSGLGIVIDDDIDVSNVSGEFQLMADSTLTVNSQITSNDGSVSLNGTNSVDVNGPISVREDITISANDGVMIDASLTSMNGGQINLRADNDFATMSQDQSGELRIGANAPINSVGGQIFFQGSDIFLEANAVATDITWADSNAANLVIGSTGRLTPTEFSLLDAETVSIAAMNIESNAALAPSFDLTLSAGDDLTVNQAIIASADNVDFTFISNSDNASPTTNTTIVKGEVRTTGDISILSDAGLDVEASIISTGAGTINIFADDDGDRTGDLDLAANALITSVGGTIDLQGADIRLRNTATAANIRWRDSNSGATTIGLGGRLDANELSLLEATDSLFISAIGITVDTPIDAVGSLTLTDTDQIIVNAPISAGGDILLDSRNELTISSAITASAGATVELLADRNGGIPAALTIDASGSVTLPSGRIFLRGGDFDIQGALESGPGDVNSLIAFAPSQAGQTISLGVGGDLTEAELNRVLGGSLILGAERSSINPAAGFTLARFGDIAVLNDVSYNPSPALTDVQAVELYSDGFFNPAGVLTVENNLTVNTTSDATLAAGSGLVSQVGEIVFTAGADFQTDPGSTLSAPSGVRIDAGLVTIGEAFSSTTQDAIGSTISSLGDLTISADIASAENLTLRADSDGDGIGTLTINPGVDIRATLGTDGQIALEASGFDIQGTVTAIADASGVGTTGIGIIQNGPSDLVFGPAAAAIDATEVSRLTGENLTLFTSNNIVFDAPISNFAQGIFASTDGNITANAALTAPTDGGEIFLSADTDNNGVGSVFINAPLRTESILSDTVNPSLRLSGVNIVTTDAVAALGATTLTAQNDITIGANLSAAGTFVAQADSDSSGVGTLTINAVVTATDRLVALSGADFFIDDVLGAIDAGSTGRVGILSSVQTPTSLITFGDGGLVDSMELGQITADALILGDAATSFNGTDASFFDLTSADNDVAIVGSTGDLTRFQTVAIAGGDVTFSQVTTLPQSSGVLVDGAINVDADVSFVNSGSNENNTLQGASLSITGGSLLTLATKTNFFIDAYDFLSSGGGTIDASSIVIGNNLATGISVGGTGAAGEAFLSNANLANITAGGIVFRPRLSGEAVRFNGLTAAATADITALEVSGGPDIVAVGDIQLIFEGMPSDFGTTSFSALDLNGPLFGDPDFTPEIDVGISTDVTAVFFDLLVDQFTITGGATLSATQGRTLIAANNFDISSGGGGFIGGSLGVSLLAYPTNDLSIGATATPGSTFLSNDALSRLQNPNLVTLGQIDGFNGVSAIPGTLAPTRITVEGFDPSVLGATVTLNLLDTGVTLDLDGVFEEGVSTFVLNELDTGAGIARNLEIDGAVTVDELNLPNTNLIFSPGASLFSRSVALNAASAIGTGAFTIGSDSPINITGLVGGPGATTVTVASSDNVSIGGVTAEDIIVSGANVSFTGPITALASSLLVTSPGTVTFAAPVGVGGDGAFDDINVSAGDIIINAPFRGQIINLVASASAGDPDATGDITLAPGAAVGPGALNAFFDGDFTSAAGGLDVASLTFGSPADPAIAAPLAPIAGAGAPLSSAIFGTVAGVGGPAAAELIIGVDPSTTTFFINDTQIGGGILALMDPTVFDEDDEACVDKEECGESDPLLAPLILLRTDNIESIESYQTALEIAETRLMFIKATDPGRLTPFEILSPFPDIDRINLGGGRE